jgi:hypothetical protein
MIVIVQESTPDTLPESIKPTVNKGRAVIQISWRFNFLLSPDL